MGYTINIDMKDELEDISNMSLKHKLSSYNELDTIDFVEAINKLSEEDCILEYLEEKYGTIIADKIKYYGDSIIDIIVEFENSDSYYKLEERYKPLMSFVHILQQSDICDDSMDLVEKYTSNIAILYLMSDDVNVISLTGGGTDLSAEIELAYYIIDGVSPINAGHIDLSEDAKKLYYFCKEKVKEKGYVSIAAIDEFVRKEGIK